MSSRLIRVPVQELDDLLLAVDRMDFLQTAPCPSVDPLCVLEALGDVYSASRRFLRSSSLDPADNPMSAP